MARCRRVLSGPSSLRCSLSASLSSFTSSRSRSSATARLLEIRLVGDRDAVVEQMLVVLGAYLFEHWLLHAPILPHRRPWLIESIRIVDRVGHFKLFAVVDQFPALDDVELRAVRRAALIDECLLLLNDGLG